MTPVPATLDVSFVSNFTGQHRVCWRIPPSLVYDCTTLVTCLGGGATCMVSIPILVDNETCLPVTYEGYVQAACEDINSLNGRIPFTITFTPTPVCASYRVTCENGPVDTIVITNGGSRYDPLPTPPPAVTILGGGIGATAIALIGNQGIKSLFTPTLNGLLYTPGVYTNVPFVTITGIGSGALATVTIPPSGILSNSSIVIDPLNTGANYVIGDTVSLDSAFMGGLLAPFQAYEANIQTLNSGEVVAVIVTNAGSGYTVGLGTIAPPPPSGTNALIDVNLLPCPTATLGLGCNGEPAPIITGIQVGQSFIDCMTTIPVIDPRYSVVAEPASCCYNCDQTTFTVPEASGAAGVDVTYIDCTTKVVTTIHLNPTQSSGPICIVRGSGYHTPGDALVTVVTTPGCP